MIIFVEGPDGVGKSTLAMALSNKLGIPLIKMPKSHESFKDGTVENLGYVFNHALYQFRQYDYVVDRGPISSIIHSVVFNRNDDIRYIDELLIKLNPIVLYLTSGRFMDLIDRKEKDELMSISIRKKIYEEYERYFMMYHPFKCYRIDTFSMTETIVYREAVTKIYER